MELLNALKLTDQQYDEQINLTIELGYENFDRFHFILKSIVVHTLFCRSD